MLPSGIIDHGGEPILWWLFWFAASLVIYTGLMSWMYIVGQRETRQADNDPNARHGEREE